MRKGKVYFVGAGPGSPDLITVRGREILRQAEVVIYDYLVDKSILEEAREGAELICCDILAKDRYSDGFLIHNDKISQLVIEKAKQGKKVIRLKNGDPAIFSRTTQELGPLVKEGIEFEIAPGVTAASAASCFSGIPLTERRFASSCILATGHEAAGKTDALLEWDKITASGTIVLYMAVENLPAIAASLIKAGKSPATPIAIVQDTALLTQKVLTGTLKDIAGKARKENIRPPAIIIIGEVVRLEKDFNWLKKTKKVLFTGISAERFFEDGVIFHLPLIKIEPAKDYRRFDRSLEKISDYDWIIFASRYGTQYFFARLNKIGRDSRSLKNIKIAAVGNSTRRRLLDFGILADLVPQEESSSGLINEFKKIEIKNMKIFLPRSDLSDKGLAQDLSKRGALVTAAIGYRNVMPKGLPDLDFNNFDEIVFTSSSGARNFVKRYGLPPKKIKIRCIGEVTRTQAEKLRVIQQC